jgi:excisionase family DNA binding protein
MITTETSQTPEAATDTSKLATDFIDTVELCRRLGCSRRTTTNLRERGKLPAVILGRLVRYHWPSVEAALLRQQKGQP